MNEDLERQLSEMGPEYRAVARRVVDAFAAPPRKARTALWTPRLSAGLAAAAAVALALGIGAMFRGESPSKTYTVRVTDAGAEYLLAHMRGDEAVKEMIRTQRPDGGWGSDFLTRQNAAALRRCESPEAQVAYRKAARNLRVRGIAP